MGTLVAMHYPTVLALGAADHTYVRCGNGGKAWSCWGGKTGGTVLRSGSGSTAQADAIAGSNERGGITCYLINGVCHQAANRILFPAGIFVTGARGYGLSSAIFGPYGRPRGPLGTCKAPFNQHTGTTGDLPECLAPTPDMTAPSHGIRATESARSSEERTYFARVSAAYGGVTTRALTERYQPPALTELMVQLFDFQVEYKLGGDRLKSPELSRLRDSRASAEKDRIELEGDFAARKISVTEFVLRSDLQAITFQKDAAGVLGDDEYHALFDLKRGEVVALADPSIVPAAYPQLEL